MCNRRRLVPRRYFLVLMAIWPVVTAGRSRATAAPLIPKTHFFDNPTRAGAQVSPDGRWLAYLAPHAGALNIWVRPLTSSKGRVVTKARRGITTFRWARDTGGIVYLQDSGGDENWNVYYTPLGDGVPVGPARNLTPFEKVQAELIALPKASPEVVVIALNRRDPKLKDAYRLNLATAELTLVAQNPGDVVDWWTDAAGRVRGATARTAKSENDIRVRAGESAPWRSVGLYADEEGATRQGFSGDGKQIYLSHAKDSDRQRLYRVDLASGTQTLVAQDPDYDFGQTILSEKTGALLGYLFVRAHTDTFALDAAFGRDLARWQSLKLGDVSINNTDDSERWWVLTFDSDTRMVNTYLYDRVTRKATFLFKNRPRLNPAQLSAMRPITYKSRDGLQIHGYLTVPRGVAAKNLPLIVNPHGGPWLRDTWGFNPEIQFLANRGYAVLQINFRGSTGYGKAFLQAGNREWGRAMLYDLLDGVDWAVGQGLVDRKRVGIYGASYGGYATLCGLTFAPEVFAAGVDVVGISNLITWIRSFPPYWELLSRLVKKRVGDVDLEESFLKERSPYFFVERIRAPLLVAQGANDPRVKQAESDQIVQALRSRGVPVEYLLKADEGHGFQNPVNRLDFYTAMERFLQQYLGGRAEGSA